MGPFVMAALVSTALTLAEPPHDAAVPGPALQVFATASFTPPQVPDTRPTWRQRPPFMPPSQPPKYEGARRLRTVVAATVAGLLAGGLIGYALDRDCGCESPGLAGLVYGVPLGAGAGAAVGILISR
jgi:hypothetical protein